MFLKLRDGRFIDSDWFGRETWGTLNQVTLFKAFKYWYIRRTFPTPAKIFKWEVVSSRLDVIEEFDTLPDGVNCIDFCDL